MTSPIARTVRRHPLVTFFALAFGIAWAFVPFGSFGAFGPLLAALVVIPIVAGRAGLRELGARLVRWRVASYWYALAIGVPLAVHLITALVQGRFSSLGLNSFTAFLMTFALRLVNPADGPLGEEPGWRGFALPTLQGSGYSPLAATTILAVLVAGWHLPLFFLEEGGLQPAVLINGLVGTVAVTFWYSWLFNRTGGSVLLVLIAHSVEGSIQAEGWAYLILWCLLAVALVAFDARAWRRPPAPEPAAHPAGATRQTPERTRA
jgi:CAAX protease family protein